ncbi:terpene synthase family protein [Streptomyces sp. MMBL 11-3]|uniref:terpene synthase family protein n=1 Tax=Streptomyces sp. MMBL 11-3 TaxID=3382639 RepID=UPI0039B5B6B2
MHGLAGKETAITTTGVALPYPVRVNPYLNDSYAESEAWARSMGMLSRNHRGSEGIWTLERFRRIAIPDLAAKIAPDAEPADLLLIDQALVWIFAYDDYFTSAHKQVRDREGGWEYARRLCDFIGPDPGLSVPEPRDPVERGLVDLWPRLATGRSSYWRREFTRAIHDFIIGAALELENICDDRVPDLIHFVKLRRQTFAGGTGACFAAMSTRAEIPERIRDTEVVASLLDAFIDVMALGNEAVSYDMEINDEGEVNNLMLVLQDLAGDTGDGLGEAHRIATRLIVDRVEYFNHSVEIKLPQLATDIGLSADELAQMRAWIRGAESYLSGLYDWYDSTARYKGGVQGA